MSPEANYTPEKYNLLIVESPTKAKTISAYLKSDEEDWVVKDTRGHILDLPKNKYGLKYEEDEVNGEWEFISSDAKAIIQELKRLAKYADGIFIATDDDREGERIASDVAYLIGAEEYERVTFREITKKAITQELYSNIRELNNATVEAAKANRFIDREIGYPVSMILKRTLLRADNEDPTRGVGRVISPSLALICEREKQIDNFVPERYYQVAIDYVYYGRSFRVHNSQKFQMEDEIHLNRFINKIQTSSHIVTKFDEKVDDVTGHKPLHTPGLQYSAWYVLQIMPEDSMKIAQKLFEIGLITYHRTDSVRLSPTIVPKIQEAVLDLFGNEYAASSPRYYNAVKKKKKDEEEEPDDSIQDAHEAIRPTNFSKPYYPDNLDKIRALREDEVKYMFETLTMTKDERRIHNVQSTEEMLRKHNIKSEGIFDNFNAIKNLSKEEMDVYRLIWARTIISQMADAKYDRSTTVITIGGEEFKARANERLFDGWEIVSEKIINISNIKKEGSWKDDIIILPRIKIDEELFPLEIMSNEHTTRRPQRYGVGTFIDTVYNLGYARPSTIGTLVKNLTDKKYTTLTKGIIYPTDLGRKVDDWTTKNFPWLNSIEHANEFDSELKKIERGEIEFADSLVIKYHEFVQEGAKALGIDLTNLESNAPSEAQIRKIHELAEKHGITVGKTILSDKQNATRFIKKYSHTVSICKCKVCSNGTVIEHDDYFKCDNRECDLFVTKKKLRGFFSNFKKEVEEHELSDIVQGGLLKKGYRAKGLISSKNEEFSTTLVIEHNEKFGWGLGFKQRD